MALGFLPLAVGTLDDQPIVIVPPQPTVAPQTAGGVAGGGRKHTHHHDKTYVLSLRKNIPEIDFLKLITDRKIEIEMERKRAAVRSKMQSILMMRSFGQIMVTQFAQQKQIAMQNENDAFMILMAD